MDIKLCKINKNYGSRKILKGLNVNVPSGEIYGFIGANGSGKTTTMKIMTGLTPANHGVVKFDGLTLKELAKSEKSFGAFISTPTYYKNLTAVENLTIVQDILGKPKSEVYRVLELVGLSEAADKEVRSFSFGMKQRLGLAFAFLNNPDILILDEPTNGLDPKGIVEIRELLRRLSQEEGKTIFISSHNISEIEAIADRVGIIHQGSLVFEGTLDELYRSNHSTYILEVNDEEKARQLLTEKRIDFMNHQTRFEINLSKSNIPSLLKELIEREISVYEMTPNKNLERIFLNLTAGGTENAISY
ncbi:ATP-binding cassette domain-containing protein [Streptococcus infantarius]|uniref:ATP-binding cassette domain-containing protein n=1 Tax=Streptococcus infantarius TaxID=102684 RepID=UPI00208FDBB2|nr:ATP-binding cassette domain-containing protein [uncultured Streptococcus sp.]MCO4489985.1 lantibiotic ABC transporter, ATP-binding protein [Streptococcus infantarius subsp. infantarius]MCO4491789.1 lantibiotic ABC transporter, ATP-binding protein [Streptococcus infantarius subsp. infantarius]MCO4500247.1 lantibiotic ABC transporter, ATP-binding protein [Streptococcus infantarius subsp. infantarius]MCO4518490.1 lantibiotic ABC transporter, ATP-binding protein [Streptococcus infantarius subsp.